MTFEQAIDSSALELLLRLEDQGFDFQVAGDRLRVRPQAALTMEQRTALQANRDGLVALVRHCADLDRREVA